MSKIKDITGQKWNKLTAIKFVKSTGKHGHIWLWKCDCGNKKEILIYSVKIGNTTSCGCNNHKKGSLSYLWTGYKEIPGEFFYNIQNSANKRKLKFNLSIKYLWKLYKKQNKKCAISGIKIGFHDEDGRKNSASVDRIDSTKGYIKGNIQWVHKTINKIKQTLSNKEFIQWCKIISNNN